MLTVYLDSCKGVIPKDFIRYIDDYFYEYFEPSWLDNEFAKRVIREIDNSEVVSDYNIYSKLYGNYTPYHLASGTKTLLILQNKEVLVTGSNLGDNCISFLLELANTKDITVSFGFLPKFPDNFDAIIQNTGNIIHTEMEYLDYWFDVDKLPTRNEEYDLWANNKFTEVVWDEWRKEGIIV